MIHRSTGSPCRHVYEALDSPRWRHRAPPPPEPLTLAQVAPPSPSTARALDARPRDATEPSTRQRGGTEPSTRQRGANRALDAPPVSHHVVADEIALTTALCINDYLAGPMPRTTPAAPQSPCAITSLLSPPRPRAVATAARSSP